MTAPCNRQKYNKFRCIGNIILKKFDFSLSIYIYIVQFELYTATARAFAAHTHPCVAAICFAQLFRHPPRTACRSLSVVCGVVCVCVKYACSTRTRKNYKIILSIKKPNRLSKHKYITSTIYILCYT